MGATPAEPAAALPAGGAGGTAARSAAARLRIVLVALGVVLALFTVLLVAYELAAARVSQHRAALEDLIRHQTGLEVRFSRLSVRWGWYGPEALFQDVELSEPERRGLRLRAPRLIVGLDTWRIARTGHLEAHRITLEEPTIDLAGDGRRASPAATVTPADVRGAYARILARWLGGQITLSGGTLRTLLPGGTEPITLGIPRAELRRLDADWSAQAQVMLPQTLGASLQVSLQMRGNPAVGEISNGEVSVEGHRLQLAAWAALAGMGARNDLPRSGSGDLELRASFIDGHLHAASGRVAAEALEWPAVISSGPVLAMDRLRGRWDLTRRGGDWHLRIDALEVGTSHAVPGAPATIVADITADGSEARGQAQHAPLAPLLSLARWRAPQLPKTGLVLGGEARELTFDWNAHRPPGTRLAAAAELQAVALADDAGQIELSGLSGRASGGEDALAIVLRAAAAQLVLPEARPALEGLEIDTRLNATTTAAGSWQLEAQNLQIRGQGLRLSASGSIGSAVGGSAPLIDTRVELKDSDVGLLADLLGPRTLADCGAAAAALGGGRIESAAVSWRGPLTEMPWNGPGTRFTGSLVLRDASLRESENWPEAAGVSAQIAWRGTHVHAVINQARVGGFALTDALADWDGHAGHTLNFAGRLAGDAQQLSAWLRSHPKAASWTPGFGSLDLRGSTVLDLELAVPRVSATAAPAAAPRVRIAALLDGVQLRPAPGLPPLEALRGTLAFSEGHLQRSTLTARWLGGPASLSVAERREHGLTVLSVSGRGVVGARDAVQAAAGNADEAGLSGSTDWSALLTVVSGDGPETRWQLHADSSLAGIASRLPEPFAKPAGTALPLHVDWEAIHDTAQLHVALGDRLAAAAGLTRSADSWRIERAAVRLGATKPALPVEPMVLLDGNVSRLDLAACLALLRQAANDAALPTLRARMTATELAAGARSFPEVKLVAETGSGGGAVRLESSALSGSVRWPRVVDDEHPARLQFSRFDLAQAGDAAAAVELAAALAPAAQLSVDQVQWQGRGLGSFSGTLAMRGGQLEASDLLLSGPSAQTHGSAHCLESGCELTFSVDSSDAAAALASFGFAPDLQASRAHLEGQLRWSPPASLALATLGGSLHMQLEDGIMRSAGDTAGVPFALLSVPALLAGMGPASGEPPQPPLRFARLSADYQVRDGQAITPGLHFDGDAEILVRGRVGLSSGDYDEQAWILRGEDRLPAAVRRLGISPRVAAVWLSLRDLWSGDGAEHARTALRLRGPWADPIVTLVE